MTRFLNSAGSPFETLKPAVPGAVAVVDKTHYTSFTPQFVDLVREHGWKNIVVAGIATESCVLKTAVDAFEANLVPWLVTDASYSHAGEEAHEAGLLVASRYIGRGQLTTSDEVMSQVTERLSA